MDKEDFKIRLSKACESALNLAREFSYNKLAENLVFKIKPNSLELGKHLTDLEKENLTSRKSELTKTLTAEQVAERLVIESKVPVWINCSVIGTKKGETIIELLTSRRYRDDIELYHQKEGNPPFHALIQLPPYLPFDSKEKFDINWREKKTQTKIKMLKAKKNLI